MDSSHVKELLNTSIQVMKRLKLRAKSDWFIYKLAFKGTLAPTLALACAQATPWAQCFGNYGYVVPIAAMLALPVFSRANFLKLLFLEMLFTCVGAAFTFLGIISTLAARRAPINVSSDSIDPLRPAYDSSACWTAAAWMAFQLFLIGSVRGPDPMMDYPCCCWMIVANFGMTYAPLLPDASAGCLLLRQIVLSLFVGYALSALVALVVLPNSCRSDLINTLHRYESSLRCVLDAIVQYLNAVECQVSRHNHSTMAIPALEETKNKLTASLRDLAAQHDALKNRRIPALREISFSTIGQDELEMLCNLLQVLFVPLDGFATLPNNIDDGLRALWGSDRCRNDEKNPLPPGILATLLNLVYLTQAWSSRVGKALALLHLKPPERCVDPHADTGSEAIDNFLKRTSLPRDQSSELESSDLGLALLNAQFQMRAFCQGADGVYQYAEAIAASKQLECLRINLPRLKAFTGAFSCPMSPLILDQSFYRVRSANPLPKSINSRVVKGLRSIYEFVSSTQTRSATRMTCATMLVALPAFLKSSQRWYIGYHVLWAQYVAGLSIRPSTGQSFYSFFLRLTGTIAAVSLSIIAWFVARGSPAGVVVLFWIVQLLPLYIQIKHSHAASFGTTFAFTVITMLGYQLQINKLGDDASEAGGAIILPIYLLGAVRLITVAGGLIVAWFWTVFPSPVTEDRMVRSRLALSIRMLVETNGTIFEMCQVRAVERRERTFELESLESRLEELSSGHATVRKSIGVNLAHSRYDASIAKGQIREQYEQASQCIDAMFSSTRLLLMAFLKLPDVRLSGAAQQRAATLNQPAQARLLESLEPILSRTGPATFLLVLISYSIMHGTTVPKYAQQFCLELLSGCKTQSSALRGGEEHASILLNERRIAMEMEKLLESATEMSEESEIC